MSIDTRERFYNLIVEYSDETEYINNPIPDQKYNLLYYEVMSSQDIDKYLDLITERKFGKHVIGSRTYQVVKPHSLSIYDFSKIDSAVLDSYGDYKDLFNQKKYNSDLSELEVFMELGKDVTPDFRIDLQKISNQDGNLSSTISNRDKRKKKAGKLTNANDQIKLDYNTFSIKDKVIKPAFDVEIIANEFAEQIKGFKKENGQIIGILGSWGRGKTYFFKKVCEELNLQYDSKEISKLRKFLQRLKLILKLLLKWRWPRLKKLLRRKQANQTDFILVKFHAWKFQKTPAVWAHLYEVFIENYLQGWWGKRLGLILNLNCQRKGHWRVWISSSLMILFGILWYLFISIESKISWLDNLIQWAGGIVAFIFILIKVVSFTRFANGPLKTLLKSFTDCPTYESLLGFQAEIQKELRFLLKSWIKDRDKKRILLFVDDIDRCSEENMVDLVDALRVMLEDPQIISRMVVVVAVDEIKLKYAIRHKYNKTGNSTETHRLEKEYLDKLFILCLKLPELSVEQKNEYLNKVIEQEGGVSIQLKVALDADFQTDINQEKELNYKETESHLSADQIEDQIRLDEMLGRQYEESLIEENAFSGHKNISKVEVLYFQGCLKKVDHSSPRSIRIQYYRYLFARNLWLKLYDKKLPYKMILDNLFEINNSMDGYPEELVRKQKYIVNMVKAY